MSIVAFFHSHLALDVSIAKVLAEMIAAALTADSQKPWSGPADIPIYIS